MITSIFIAVGSNVGRRLDHLRWAVRKLNAHPLLSLHSTSSVFESEAHTLDESQEQSAYLNAVIELHGSMKPEALLDLCLNLEAERGRFRQEGIRWEPRTLDLDIIAYGSLRVLSESLVIPHPRLAERRFVLEPWSEIAPDFEVPDPFAKNVAELLVACGDAAGLHKTPFQLLD